MKRLLMAAAVLFWSVWCAAEDTAVPPEVFSISEREVTVTAPEPALAASMARHAQDLKGRIEELFGYRALWRERLLIDLAVYKRRTGGEEVELCSALFRRAGERKEVAEIYRNRLVYVIAENVAYFIVRDIIYQSVPATSPLRKNKTPRWVYIGAVENLVVSNRLIFQKYIGAKVESGQVFSLDALMQLVQQFSDEKRNELFRKQSASLFQFLIRQKYGRSKLCKALISSRGRYLTESVLYNFGFKTIEELEDAWKKFAKKKSTAFVVTEKLSLYETAKRLEGILRVEIDIIDPETLSEEKIITDFAGLSRQKNRYRANAIAFEKHKQLHGLLMRSKKEYHAIIAGYQKCLKVMLSGRYRRSREIFQRAEKMRKRIEKKSPYLKLNQENNEDTGN